MTDRDRLVALREKYAEMRRLRDADAARRPGDPRRDMAALAARFPGALRELDRLPMPEIDARIDRLDRVLSGAAPAPDWVRWQFAFHGWLRAALRVRRLVRGAASIEAALGCVHEGYRPGAGEPALAAIDPQVLKAIVEPPGGRLTDWVIERVAADDGRPAAEVREALLGG